MRILFVTSTRIGDAVLSTGLLDHLLRAYPEARFTIACGPVAEGVFARMPRREETIVLAKRSLSLHWLELWRRVAGRRWDLVVDLRGSALAWTLRAGTRAVMRGGRRPGHRLGHIAETLALDPPPMPVAWTAPEDEARADALLGLAPAHLPGQVPILAPILALGPTANWGAIACRLAARVFSKKNSRRWAVSTTVTKPCAPPGWRVRRALITSTST